MSLKKTKLGFTLTELSVAIVFVSILLLTVAVVTINMIHVYHKGATMKSVNSVGLDLIDEINSAISASPMFDPEALCKGLVDNAHGFDKCMEDRAMKYVFQQFVDDIVLTKNGEIKKGPGSSPYVENYLPVAGVLCTGKYSYLWETGYILSQNEAEHSMTSYFYSNDNDFRIGANIRLRKYSDVNRSLCITNFPAVSNIDPTKHYPVYDGPAAGTNITYYYGSTPGEHDSQINKALADNLKDSPVFKSTPLASELINTSDIAVYSFSIDPPTLNDNSRGLFAGTFVLGSITGDIEINTGEDYSSCNLEDTSIFDVEYCATNKFNFATRAIGGNSGN